MKKLNWDSKVTKKHIKEASKVGLELIGLGNIPDINKNGSSTNTRTYKFIECGHTKVLATSAVRGGRVQCKECTEEKYIKDANEAGLKYIGRGSDHQHKKYQFKKCGHFKEISPTNVSLKNFNCSTCYIERLTKEAAAKGLNLIGKGKRGKTGNLKYLYQFKDCLHEKLLEPSVVKTANPICDECIEKKWKKIFQDNGLSYVGKGKDRHYKKARFVSCGHSVEIHQGQVQEGYFVCNICEETSRTLPSKVYLLKLTFKDKGWLKLGYAKSIKTRIRDYKLLEKVVVNKLKVINFDTGIEAEKFEQDLHQKYKNKKLKKSFTKKYMVNGFNECYPSDMEETFLKELANHGNK